LCLSIDQSQRHGALLASGEIVRALHIEAQKQNKFVIHFIFCFLLSIFVIRCAADLLTPELISSLKEITYTVSLLVIV
jgi:hypothetical protein